MSVFAILVAIVTLLVQAISIHKIIKNSILSTRLFIGISDYIVTDPIYWSNGCLSLFAFSNVQHELLGRVDILVFYLSLVITLCSYFCVGIVLTYNKFKTGLTSH